MENQPQHDEIHVISDIHMGGSPGFQILKETTRLAGFIGWVAVQRPDQSVALVLNGDIIDTLAEDALQGYIAITNAAEIVSRIMTDPSFAVIWQALADFVKRPHRKLVLIVGNHDLELAFPSVQRTITERLAGDDLEARARIEFSTIGAGYTCNVGNATVYCTHGNEVDEWNFTRYEDISKAARRLGAGLGLEPDEWRPNAGTKMVRDVMNEVKRKYRWVDLLKPEMEAAVSVLSVLDASVLAKLGSVAALLTEAKIEKAEADARLSGTLINVARESVANVRVDSLLGRNLLQAIDPSADTSGASADDMLLDAERSLSEPRRQRPASAQGTLGRWQYYIDRIRGVEPEEALRRAVIDWIRDDQSFVVDHPDDTFKQINDVVSPAIDVVITGHTHLARSISRGGGKHYFNTGTWIRLMKFTAAMLDSKNSFEPIYRVLVKGDIEGIDSPPPGVGPILFDRTSAVTISADQQGVTGHLLDVTGNGTTQVQAMGAAEFLKP